MKFREPYPPTAGFITNIKYENIVMDGISQYPIWIGPAQQSDHTNLCHPHPCSICWPMIPNSKCEGQQAGLSHFANLTLRNILINDIQGTPGVILAHPIDPMNGVLFENVRVKQCDRTTSTFEETFPELVNVPTSDRYVTYFWLSLVGMLGVLVVAPCACCIRAGCCTKAFCRLTFS